ncbi:MAG: lipid hydroperoxide peroxidase [Nitrospirae bacterium RBG_13_39_12]|nr:MAG: lipid hydroperoxide peroxidase [Nitrospirae bacterium RBG_13_39_12]
MARTGIITMHGNPLTLAGTEVQVGDKSPPFTVIDRDMKEVGLHDFTGKIKIISVTPSLDTPVCEVQARKFNEEAAKLSADIVILNISMDLPFAISRFCTAAGIDRVQAFSDHRDASFGTAYGILIKELRLLARSIFIVDKDDVIRYKEIVRELTELPDFKSALEAVKKIS